MNQEELVANLGTIARSGSKVTVVDFLPKIQLVCLNVTLVFIMRPVDHVSSPHRRRFWMPCRTRRRPAAPSLVSSGWDSTLPSWWPTVLTSTPSPPSPAHPDTSGPQTGEREGWGIFQHQEREKRDFLSATVFNTVYTQ